MNGPWKFAAGRGVAETLGKAASIRFGSGSSVCARVYCLCSSLWASVRQPCAARQRVVQQAPQKEYTKEKKKKKKRYETQQVSNGTICGIVFFCGNLR